ncbi:MAG: hypothetical protein MZU79_04085 [Anaerotruncus sp.]|nr:hypothetical protein [Anaerotruncus sp.]
MGPRPGLRHLLRQVRPEPLRADLPRRRSSGRPTRSWTRPSAGSKRTRTARSSPGSTSTTPTAPTTPPEPYARRIRRRTPTSGRSPSPTARSPGSPITSIGMASADDLFLVLAVRPRREPGRAPGEHPRLLRLSGSHSRAAHRRPRPSRGLQGVTSRTTVGPRRRHAHDL